jgi:hypothetical protein
MTPKEAEKFFAAEERKRMSAEERKNADALARAKAAARNRQRAAEAKGRAARNAGLTTAERAERAREAQQTRLKEGMDMARERARTSAETKTARDAAAAQRVADAKRERDQRVADLRERASDPARRKTRDEQIAERRAEGFNDYAPPGLSTKPMFTEEDFRHWEDFMRGGKEREGLDLGDQTSSRATTLLEEIRDALRVGNRASDAQTQQLADIAENIDSVGALT